MFAAAQHGKCGYCEMMVIGGQPGDVEHFRPKGEIWALRPDKETWGKQKPWSSSVEGRLHDLVSHQGYWWMAYEWSNYLLACTICNSAWKLSFFPVDEEPRTVPPSEGVAETPLLLDPFGDLNPADHLEFTDFGQISARNSSRFGRETIRTCGLDRNSLLRPRLEKARRAFYLARELLNAEDKQIDAILRDFQELGRIEYAHSGMVRAIFEQQCGVNLGRLEKRLGPLPSLPPEAEPPPPAPPRVRARRKKAVV
jgi:hypothetical protein